MGISQPDAAAALEAFIRAAFRVTPDDPHFSREAHLFESGYVDSAGVVELIAYIESTFAVTLEEEHIFSDAFTTIAGISALLSRCVPR